MNLFNNQEPLWVVILFFILMTLMCNSGVILQGEIKCKSLLEVQRTTIIGAFALIRGSWLTHQLFNNPFHRLPNFHQVLPC